MKSTTTMGVKLDIETRERLKRLGTIKRRSPHWMMREAIQKYLVEEERREQERIEDQERWERYQRTRQAAAHEDVEAWLESWGSNEEGQCPRCRD